MKALIWDFDGTLGYRQGGMWGAALLQVIQQDEPTRPISLEQLRPLLQTGFPCQSSGQPHPELSTPEKWWRQVEPIFERALLGNGFDPQRAQKLAKQVRPVYTDPSAWRLFVAW